MATIELINISKTYASNVQAVRNVSLIADDGEFIVLVGPSGCGKTTILRMVAGLEDITEGKLLLNGEIANKLEPADRNIGMVFQEYALYPHLSVFENIAFPLKVQKRNHRSIANTPTNKSKNDAILSLTKQDIQRLVMNVAEHLELTDLINRKPKELSGGQRQRVSLGRAIIRQPNFFLFDEPLSNLDAKLRILMRQEIISLQRKFGITSIYVTHDQVEAMTMGTKIAVMKNGILQQFDTPANIYHKPANLFVADFIGMPNINLFNCVLNDNTYKEINSNCVIPILQQLQTAQFTPKMTIAIRPENILLGQNQNDEFVNLNVKVDNVEFLGNETIIYFTTGNTHKRIRTAPIQDIRIGDNVYINFNTNDLLFFNEAGNRIN